MLESAFSFLLHAVGVLFYAVAVALCLLILKAITAD